MNHFAKAPRAALLIGLTVLIAPRAEASSLSTYFSLGDSIAYGSGTTEDAAPGSTTNQGFVSQFAAALAQANGGVAPTVYNFALPNETLGSFVGGNANPDANTFNTGLIQTQNLAFQHFMATQLGEGQKIDTLTISLGTSDVMNILNAPGFSSLSLANQSAAVDAGLAKIQSQYSALLNLIHSDLPNTKIDLIGAYNPFHATPSDPLAPIAEPAFLGLNKIIKNEAATVGGTYVDTYTAFLGHEGTYTNILGGKGNIAPTALGFSAIATLVDSTIVPEPSTIFIAGFGVIGLAGHAWRRRKARAA